MSYIKTWVERCDEHPDHQSGMVSNGMIQARMQEEIDDLREALAIQQGCCDGAAAQDAHVRREREEHRADVERQRAEIERLRAALGGICIDGPDADGLFWVTIKHPAIAVQIHVMVGNVNLMVSQAFMEFEEIRRKALEGKP